MKDFKVWVGRDEYLLFSVLSRMRREGIVWESGDRIEEFDPPEGTRFLNVNRGRAQYGDSRKLFRQSNAGEVDARTYCRK